jgi:superfamily II DNA or RNA helicase
MKIKYYSEAEVYVDCDFDEARDIGDRFSFYSPKAHFSKKYQAGIWDGRIRLFNQNAGTMPFGLLPKLIKYLKYHNYDFTVQKGLLDKGKKYSAKKITDFARKVLKLPKEFDPIYDHQIKAIQNFLYHKKMIGISATASGKSLVYYILFNMLQFLYGDMNFLLIVPRTSLVEQMAKDFNDYGKNFMDMNQHVHRIYSGKEKYTDKSITVSTWQSLQNMPKEYFEKFNCLVVDEVHEATAKELPRIANLCINAMYRIGMSGHLKDCKISKLQLEGLLGRIKTFSKSADLIEKGILSDIKIKAIILKHTKKVAKACYSVINKGDTEEKKKGYKKELDLIRSVKDRKKFVCKLAASRKKNTMVLFKSRDYGGSLNRLLKKNFPEKRVYYIDGTIPVKHRERVREMAEKFNNVIIVASYGTFSTGINIKNLHNLIFGEPILSSVKVIQSIGRVLRKYFNKYARLYDVADDLTFHNKKNYAIKHFHRRIRYYDQEQFDYDVSTIKI